MSIDRRAFHYFVITPSGRKHTEDILAMLKGESEISVHHTRHYKRIKAGRVIALLLDSDLSIQNKKKMLRELVPGSLIVIVCCSNRKDDYFGEGANRHKENLKIKELKHRIRDRYDSLLSSKQKGKHVVYASDNELQADYLLKYMGYPQGINKFMPKPGISFPSIGNGIRKFTIKKMKMDDITARFFHKKGRGKTKMMETPIAETPHFHALKKGIQHYADYINKLKYKVVTYNTDPNRFAALSTDLKYLSPPHDSNYIMVRHRDGKYILLNGHHRASILLSRGVKEITVAITYD